LNGPASSHVELLAGSFILSGRSVELADAHPGGERDPLGRGEHQCQAGRVLGVLNRTCAAVEVGDLDALPTLVAALVSPRRERQDLHGSAGPCVITLDEDGAVAMRDLLIEWLG
jgi:hypothetical protein